MLRSLLLVAVAGCTSPPLASDAGLDAGLVADAGLDAGEPPDGGCPAMAVSGDLGAAATSLDIDALCSAFEAALCESPCAECGSAPENCRAWAQLICEGGPASPETRAAIAAGDLSYDALAAGIAIGAIADAAAECTAQPTRIDLDMLFAATGALYGAIAEGMACTRSSDCALGLFCPDGVCTAIPGAPCASFGLCAESPDRVSLACEGTPCEPTSCAVGQGALGEACTNEFEPCAEGRCAGALCRPWQCAGAWY